MVVAVVPFHLNMEERGVIVEMRSAGMSTYCIAKALKMSQSLSGRTFVNVEEGLKSSQFAIRETLY